MNFLLCLLLFLFPPIQETIPNGPFTYPGSSIREVIVLDPANSPLLEKAYENLQNELSLDNSEWEILQITSLYVRQQIFDLSLCDKKRVHSLIQRNYPNEQSPSISLETFLKEKTGICRHIALTTTYLIDRLIKDGWLIGTAFLIRENLFNERHAWTLLLSEEGAWHLDSFWNVLENGKTPSGFSHLCKKYGKDVMDRQKNRWENDH